MKPNSEIPARMPNTKIRVLRGRFLSGSVHLFCSIIKLRCKILPVVCSLGNLSLPLLRSLACDALPVRAMTIVIRRGLKHWQRKGSISAVKNWGMAWV